VAPFCLHARGPDLLAEVTAPFKTTSSLALSARASHDQNKGTPDASTTPAPACVALLRVTVAA
jgi:hypothetical protein